MKNPNCDNDKCKSETGEVRTLPTGGEGNIILCRACFEHELRFRRERNRELSADCAFALPTWESLKVYLPARRLTLQQANALIAECDKLFSRAARARERGNNSGNATTLEECDKHCDTLRNRAEKLLAPLGVAVDYPGLFPSFTFNGGNYYTTESAVSAALADGSAI